MSSLITALVEAEELPTEHYGLRFMDRRERVEWMSWVDVARGVRRTAGALAARGVRRGDRVALVLPTGPEFIWSFFACQALEALPVPLYPPVRLGRIREYHQRTTEMLRAVRARAVVSDRRISRILGEIVHGAGIPLGVFSASELGEGPERELGAPDPDGIAMVQFSSGTTVSPKPVALTHRQVIANAARIVEAIERVGDRRPHEGCSWLPLYHDMGLIGCVIPAVLGAGALTLIPPELFLARPSVWLRAIARFRALVSPAPNFAYGLCVDRVTDAELEGCDLSCWRMALNGAEPISASTLRAFERRFSGWGLRDDTLMPVYGLSEAALAVTFTPPGTRYTTRCFDVGALARGEAKRAERGHELVSVGRPLPDFGVEIRDGGGGELSEGTVGRIWVRGPSVMQGYLDRQDAPIVDGWLDTGDLGFLEAGELFVTGRAKDMLVVRGQNHAPHDLERAVDEVDGVRTGCAAAVADISSEGERVVLFVEHRAGEEVSAEACHKGVLAATGISVSEVLVVAPGTLPRTSSGKIRRGEALRRYREGTLAPPGAVTPWVLAGALSRSALGYLRHRFRSEDER